jgi:thioredoxin
MKKISTLLIVLAIIYTASAADPQAKETAKPIDLTKETFLEKVFDYETNPDEWKYIGDKPAIVDFHAEWCGPCRITSPILAELAAEYGGELYIYKINVDEEPEIAQMFGAKSIPMFLFIPMDEVPQMGVGALPKKSFHEVIDTFLLKKDQDKK